MANNPTAIQAEPPQPEVAQVREIATNLSDLRWKRNPDDDTLSEKKSTALEDAICDERWDLVRKAAWLLEREALPRLDSRRLKEDAKWVAYCLSKIEEPKLSKRQILLYIERVHPEIHVTINLSPRGQTDFWSEVGPVPQSRGKSSPESKMKFAELVARAIQIKRAGFPDFLGPRDNPNWE